MDDMETMLRHHAEELEREMMELLQLPPSGRTESALAPVVERWNIYRKACKEMDEHHAPHSRGDMAAAEISDWMSGLHNADGTTGPHWTVDQTRVVGDALKVSWAAVCPQTWNAAMNMMYSDYWAVAEKYKQTTPEFYGDLAKAFLFDADGGDPREKLARYYFGVVRPAQKK